MMNNLLLLTVISLGSLSQATATLDDSPTRDFSQPLCFETRDELDQAIEDYTSGDAKLVQEVELVYGPIATWCTGQIADFSHLFDGNATFNEPLYGWDLSQATTTQGMFFRATAFDQDLSTWDVSNVQDMEGMFAFASSFSQDLSSWNTSRVTSMRATFLGATHFEACSALLEWDTTSVTDTARMLRGTACTRQDDLIALLGEEAFAEARRY